MSSQPTDARRWTKSKLYPGLRYREHPTRRHGAAPDRYFVLRFKLDGKDKQESLGWSSQGWTEKKANARLAELLEAQRTGEGPATLAEKREKAAAERAAREEAQAEAARDAMTFDDFFAQHYAPLASTDKKHGSWRREDSLHRNWISKSFGGKALKKIGAVDLERLKRNMAAAGLRPRTTEYALAVVRQVFNHARRIGFYTQDSPTKLVKKPKVNNARLRYLTQDEARTLLEALAEVSPDLHDVALLSLHCGLRFGEIAALTWNNVDLNAGRLALLDTKHGDRVVPLTARTAAMLASRKADSPGGLVFPARGGGVRERISKVFAATVESLGLNAGREDARERMCFHTLRHSFASWHVLAGTDLYTLGRLMGHKTPAMTARYGHLSPEGAVKATRAFEASLDQEATPGKIVGINGQSH